ncbi:hypothetical protein [Staphylococcus epidermidis]|uniref:hypothetical protein n=1 Tax=Staphylococcus epidermidis TaxID=1282 RepID=UPI0011AA73B2|nr:hypothetical protein [Staphylococcus epidermidis]
MVGRGGGGENGILLKGGEFVEGGDYVDTMVVDKRGRISNGEGVVSDYVGENDRLEVLGSGENT